MWSKYSEIYKVLKIINVQEDCRVEFLLICFNRNLKPQKSRLLVSVAELIPTDRHSLFSYIEVALLTGILIFTNVFWSM